MWAFVAPYAVTVILVITCRRTIDVSTSHLARVATRP
jgi:hypothetical protein